MEGVGSRSVGYDGAIGRFTVSVLRDSLIAGCRERPGPRVPATAAPPPREDLPRSSTQPGSPASAGGASENRPIALPDDLPAQHGFLRLEGVVPHVEALDELVQYQGRFSP